MKSLEHTRCHHFQSFPPQDCDIYYDICQSNKEIKGEEKRVNLQTLAVTCNRFGQSDRAGAATATAVLTDFGFVSQEENTKVIDRNEKPGIYKNS
jgi:hypothetical protein